MPKLKGIGNCKWRGKTSGCKLKVCADKEVCDIRKAEPNCPDYGKGE